jgi:hypothetical protein
MGSSAIIVIPCHNEAQRLKIHKFGELAGDGHAQRFLFVNNGSTDGTLRGLQTLRHYDPKRFAIGDPPRNVGKADAVRIGVLRAFDDSPDYIGYRDADLAAPLEATPIFCEVLDSRPDLEMVFGARVRLLGRSIEPSALRHYLGRIFATAASPDCSKRAAGPRCPGLRMASASCRCIRGMMSPVPRSKRRMSPELSWGRPGSIGIAHGRAHPVGASEIPMRRCPLAWLDAHTSAMRLIAVEKLRADCRSLPESAGSPAVHRPTHRSLGPQVHLLISP